jgi:LmbE family N-acetylglucosaminyl deacetylase
MAVYGRPELPTAKGLFNFVENPYLSRMKVDILAIAAHPDDVELSCCGTLLRHIDQGKTVGLIDLTRGELGTRGNAEIREEEAKNAAELMGAEFRKNLDMPDGFFRHSKENLLKLIQVATPITPRRLN